MVLLSDNEIAQSSHDNQSFYISQASSINFMQSILHDDSMENEFDDEVISFSGATTIGDKTADPFEWCFVSEKRYPNIAPVACDILIIQASLVCSEECFSIAANLLDTKRTLLCDESIRSLMLVRVWNRRLVVGKPFKFFKSRVVDLTT